ncbi:MAG: glycerol-3-phosphate dehydrogenase/oxidase [Desulfamplus sp.]|nr:glycerol-3-phosphate dehydrogenase/oxidase [Desulfamplus sp.]
MQKFDIIIIGGGITGAGIFREAAALGFSVLLIEARDFASATSSRSSKLVHGGLRYLKEGALNLAMDSVRHRERLLKEMPGLVTPLPFMMLLYGDTGPLAVQMKAGLFLYDLMAGRQNHRFKNRDDIAALLPYVRRNRLKGAFLFKDAQVDDARLVLRLIQEGASREGAVAVNYCEARELLRNNKGRVTGVSMVDAETGEEKTAEASVVINASGVLADGLHPMPEKRERIRPLRGSHLVFPSSLMPLGAAVSFLHPRDRRPVFLIPWEGALLLGTTDVDAQRCQARTPCITREESRYLLAAAGHAFPDAGFDAENILATFAGLRPVITRGNLRKDPSRESREHLIWHSPGLVSVTGGKLTTFRKLAWDTLDFAAGYMNPAPGAIPRNSIVSRNSVFMNPVARNPVARNPVARNSVSINSVSINLMDRKSPVVPENSMPCPGNIPEGAWQRLCCRYGTNAGLIAMKEPGMTETIPGTNHIWGEIPIAAGEAGVRHLDDLLLRRLRVGLLLREGGMEIMERIRELAMPVLGWSDDKWDDELCRYRLLWQREHGVVS